MYDITYIRVRWSGVDWIGVTQDGEGWCLRWSKRCTYYCLRRQPECMSHTPVLAHSTLDELLDTMLVVVVVGGGEKNREKREVRSLQVQKKINSQDNTTNHNNHTNNN